MARKAKASSRRERNVLIFADPHFPLEDRDAYDCFLQALDLGCWDTLVCLGDVAENSRPATLGTNAASGRP